MPAPTVINIRPIPIKLTPVIISAGSGNFVVLAGTAGTVIRLWGLILSASTAQTLTILSAANAITGAMTLAAWPFVLPCPNGTFKRDSAYPWAETNVAEDLKFTSSAGTVSGIAYVEQVVPVTTTGQG